ncbi:MAG: zinc-binding alcohol dehydrogenase [Chloroflexota bacterium]|nr:zinc-binding alcohol dehydrogenase [Chloroflexota bacterium]
MGEVIEVGEGLKEEWVGRRVATYRRGYHAQYIVGSPDDSPVIPPEVPDDQATFFALAAIAMNGVRKGRVRWGEAVVVYGLGIVGQLALRFCHFAGAELVVGIDIAEPRIAYLPDSPRIRGINPADCDPRKYMQELNRGRLADVVFEVTGNPDIIPEEFHVLRRQGRFVVLSSPRDNTTFDFHDLCNWPSFQIIGAHASSHPPVSTPQNPWTKERHAQLFFGLIADGELDIESLISHRESYEKAPELYNMLLEDRSRAMGVVLEW